MKVQEVLVNKRPYKVKIVERNGDNFLVRINEKIVKAEVRNSKVKNTTIIEIGGKPFKAQMKRISNNTLQIKFAQKMFEVQHQYETSVTPIKERKVITPHVAKTFQKKPVEKNAVVAPIAGRIALLKVSIGQKVSQGDCICILEAMKMENEVSAPRIGVVKDIKVSQGAIVKKGDILAIIS
ncbi:MAG: biotin/lipoyl-binding protein [Candidatus Bathyarchaeota archaeon]